MISLGSTTQKAKKPHRCDSCGGTIKIGHTYVRARIVDGGEAWVWKAHGDCQEAGQILWNNDIMGDDNCLVNVSDMDSYDRRLVAGVDPDLASRLWQNWPPKDTP